MLQVSMGSSWNRKELEAIFFFFSPFPILVFLNEYKGSLVVFSLGFMLTVHLRQLDLLLLHDF